MENKIFADKAMLYELLIRRVYNCGRYGVDGADADVYRRLVRSAMRKNINAKFKAEHVTSLSKITRYLKKAIQHIQKDSFTKEQQEKLLNIGDLLAQPTIEKIIEVIDKLEVLFFDVGLYPVD